MTCSPDKFLGRRKGSYLLLIELPEDHDIAVGSLGVVRFPRGDYAYVGSALGGFKSRLNRHLRKEKIPKWHIDYLLRQDEVPKSHIDNRLQRAALKSIIICETEERVECVIAQALRRRFESIPSFGSSDCKCPSHLFFTTGEKRLRNGIMMAIRSLTLEGREIKC